LEQLYIRIEFYATAIGAGCSDASKSTTCT